MSGLNQHLHRLDTVLSYASGKAKDPRIDGRRRYEIEQMSNDLVITWPEMDVRCAVPQAIRDMALADIIIDAFLKHDKALTDAKLARNPLRRLQPRVRGVA